jgi:uncharacterized protein (UPF0248 family)
VKVHVERKYLKHFSGNLLFSSRGACKGYTTSRKDDIESALNVFAYLLNGNTLPWEELLKG